MLSFPFVISVASIELDLLPLSLNDSLNPGEYDLEQWFLAFTNLPNPYANLKAFVEPQIFAELQTQKSTTFSSKTLLYQ